MKINKTVLHIIKIINNSTLCKEFKKELKKSVNNNNGEFIIHLDECLEFLKNKGFNIRNITKDEDIKLKNYLIQYISQNISNFPFLITTEDYVILFDPLNTNVKFSKSELPKKPKIKDKNLYTAYIGFLDIRPYKKDKNGNNEPYGVNEHMGCLNFFSHQLSYKDCEIIVNLFEQENFDEIIRVYDKYFFIYPNVDKRIELEYIKNHRDKFKKLDSFITKVDPRDYV